MSCSINRDILLFKCACALLKNKSLQEENNDLYSFIPLFIH